MFAFGPLPPLMFGGMICFLLIGFPVAFSPSASRIRVAASTMRSRESASVRRWALVAMSCSLPRLDRRSSMVLA